MTSFDRILGVRRKVVITAQDNQQILEFDATINELHTGDAELTRHPVEQGVDITDHIRRLPEELQITGIVSDTPVLFLASLRAPPAISGGDPKSRSQDAYGFLKGLKDSGQLVQVITTLREYANMAITAFSVLRDAARGRILEVNLGLTETIIATTEVVEAPEPVSQGRKGQSKKGNQPKQIETQANQTQASSTAFDVLFPGG